MTDADSVRIRLPSHLRCCCTAKGTSQSRLPLFQYEWRQQSSEGSSYTDWGPWCRLPGICDVVWCVWCALSLWCATVFARRSIAAQRFHEIFVFLTLLCPCAAPNIWEMSSSVHRLVIHKAANSRTLVERFAHPIGFKTLSRHVFSRWSTHIQINIQ